MDNVDEIGQGPPPSPNPASNASLNPQLSSLLWYAGQGGWVVRVRLKVGGAHVDGQVGQHPYGASKVPIGPVMVPFGAIQGVEMPIPAGKKVAA